MGFGTFSKYKLLIHSMPLQSFENLEMQASLTWQLSSKIIEFAYEDGDPNLDIQNDFDQGNMRNTPKNNLNADNLSGGYTDESYEVSREVIDFQNKSEEIQMLQIITESKLLLDEVSGACVFTRKQQLPKITVSLLGQNKSEGEGVRNLQKKYVELHLCEKSRNTEFDKYRINKRGIIGKTRIQIAKERPVVFDKIRFNYSSDKSARLLIILYQVDNDHNRKYKNVMASNQINVLNEHKIISIDSMPTIKTYFEEQPVHIQLPETKNIPIGTKSSTQISLQKISDEIRYFETYLTKKSKKNNNLLYILNKYSDILDLYFLAGSEDKDPEQRFKELWREALQIINAENLPQSERTCNYLHPEARFVLKINAPLLSVKIIIKKEFTSLLSIIASGSDFNCGEGKWIKLTSKAQQKNQTSVKHTEVQNSKGSGHQGHENVGNHSNNHPAQTPKKYQKKDDQEFRQQYSDDDSDDDGQYEGQQSENQSPTHRKRGRRIGQRKTENQYKKSNVNPRYSTRHRAKVTEDDQVHNKRLAMQKKNQEKEILNSRQNSSQNMNLPFKILSPHQANEIPKNSTQEPKMPMMNMGGMVLPMSMNQAMPMAGKKPDDKPASKGGMQMPIMMPMGGSITPQMGTNGMPVGMQMIPMGNGMQAVMIPMPMDKVQGQNGSNQMGAMMGGFPMGLSNQNNSNNNQNGGIFGMPPGFLMQVPGQDKNMAMGMMGQQQKPQQDNKNKDDNKKDEKKSESFPPVVDMNKFMGQMSNMQGMPMGQFMQMPQMSGMMVGQNGQTMPNMFSMGGGMAPMMVMPGQKPNSETKEENKQMQPMPMMMQGPGGFPIMMSSSQGNDSQQQQQQMMGMMSMMGNPSMMQNMQNSSQSTHPQQSQQPQGMMMPMPMTNEMMQQMMRGMNPQQQQQMMMKMMSGMYQMPKNDSNDGSKK